MQSVERNKFSVQLELGDKFASSGNLFAFVLNKFATKVVLGRSRYGGDDVVTSRMLGLLAIDGHHLVVGNRTSDAPSVALLLEKSIFGRS